MVLHQPSNDLAKNAMNGNTAAATASGATGTRKALFSKNTPQDEALTQPEVSSSSREVRVVPIRDVEHLLRTTEGIDPDLLTKAEELLERKYQEVASKWPGFIAREGQAEMMRAALLTFLSSTNPGGGVNGHHLAELEAGTGTGKTVAYCLAAIVASEVTGKKVLISTATVALQEQLAKRDLPRLAEIVGNLKFDILKGRGRYVCKSRLENVLADDFTPDWLTELDAGKVADASAVDKLSFFAKGLLSDLDKRKWDGDIDSLPVQPQSKQWSQIQADGGTCTANKCKNYSSCAFYKARNKAAQASLVVGNHALVLATLNSESTLIDAKEYHFVFDEAHHLPDIAASQFTQGARLAFTGKVIEKLRGALQKAGKLLPFKMRPEEQSAIRLCTEAVDVIRNIELAIQSSRLLEGIEPVHRFVNGEIPEGLAAEFTEAAKLLTGARTSAQAICAELDKDDESLEKSKIEENLKMAVEIKQYLARVNEMITVFESMAQDDRIPLVKWIERIESGSGVDIKVSASSLTPAAALVSILWSNVASAVCTSATLRACGSFEYFDRLSGLNRYKGRRSAVVSSPFDYKAQSELRVAHMKTNPKSPEFSREFNERLPELLKEHQLGQLVLFTSRRQMEASFKALPADLVGSVMMQGEVSRSEMLSEHGRRVSAGRSSILFGLQSMGEGLDLPGDLCTHVVVDKLPFTPPTSPAEAGLSEWLVNQGRDPFAEISVPKTSMRLAQWVGRAIRSVSDRAVITVCDTRLATTSYGRDILAGLPPFPFTVCTDPGVSARTAGPAGRKGIFPSRRP